MSDLAQPQKPWDRTPASEREYFEILGDGLVVLLAPREEAPSEGRWNPPSGGAWLHVGGDGRVRAFSGKVEVGQGTQTALSLLVAEEMRVPLDRVEVVMGDTDLCPWDMGTFGSRSMPDAASALRLVAAATRDELLLRAVHKGLGPKKTLQARDGQVRRGDSGPRASYGDLVGGERRTVTVDPRTALTPPAEWTVAGHAVHDPGAEAVVTGRRRYASDVRRPRMGYGAILRPPKYGSRPLRVDGSKVLARPGVVCVTEGDFVGVVADSLTEARSALSEIQVEWSPSSPVGEADVEAYLRSHPSREDDWDTDAHELGDVESALREAPVRVDATYRTAYIAHVPLEPRSALAEWIGDRVTIWVGTQTPFRAREQVARGLGVPVESVRVIVPYTGAGFGGKHGGEMSLAAARLARSAGRPVRIAYSREEEFRYGYFRPMAIIDVRAGATAEGRVSAWALHNVNAGAAALRTPYVVPHVREDNELSESPLAEGPYRSLAANTNNFARESAMDELASSVGVDPLRFREEHLADDRLRTVLRTAADAANWTSRAKEPGRGMGLALGREKGGRVATVASIHLDADRRLNVDRLVTAFEAGAIVHPENLRAQVEGACVMALGGALFEAVHFSEGRLLNPRLSAYRVPRFSDVPDLQVILVDRKDLPPAGGGETPMIAVAPALGNAIADATGVRLRSLPLVPDGIIPYS